MNDLKNIVLTVKNHDGDSLVMTLNWDTDLSGLVAAFRSIAFWLTFSPALIDEYLPDGTQGWSYDDEKEPDEHGSEGDD